MSSLSNKNILLISPEPWDHIRVSKHHYALELLKRDNKVFFLNPPSKQTNISILESSNLHMINYKGHIKGMSKLPKLIRQKLTRNDFYKLEKLGKVKFDVVWSFDNSVFYDLDSLPLEVLKISHIVDLNMNFQFARAASSADYCFCTTDILKAKLSIVNPNTFKINHGLAERSNHIRVELPGTQALKVVYMGNLAMKYLDWQLLLESVKQNRDSDFIFYGPNALQFDLNINVMHQAKKELSGFSHVYFPGKVESFEIPSILDQADCLILAYQESHHDDQANPHKIMEYLASGKPIIATSTKEYQGLGLLEMSSKNTEFTSLLKQSIAQIDQLNSVEKITARQQYASNHSYKKQVSKVEQIISINPSNL